MKFKGRAQRRVLQIKSLLVSNYNWAETPKDVKYSILFSARKDSTKLERLKALVLFGIHWVFRGEASL